MTDSAKSKSKAFIAPAINCYCAPVNYAIGAIGVTKKKAELGTNVRTIDFGEVMPGAQFSRHIEIKNLQNTQSLFHIDRKSYVNNIYQTFRFEKHNTTLSPKGSAQMKVTYSPLVEHDKSFDCFHVFGKDGEVVEKLYLRGGCLGASIKCSAKYMYFIISPNVKKRVNTFELKNLSKVPATFQLDVNENDDLFQVDIVNGQIQPRRNIYIRVTFNGKTEGLHFKRLVVLIYRHEPIMMDLLGLYTENTDNKINLDSVSFYPNEAPHNYAAYFNDYGFSEEKVFPVTVSQSYIDFGRILPKNYGNNRTNMSAEIITNNMHHDILIRWQKDPDNIFVVTPNEVRVPPDKSGYFEVSFNPDYKNRLYHKVLSAQIHWRNNLRTNSPVASHASEHEDEENVPLVSNLTVIGHSFPENQCWINAAEMIPSTITFPACLPGYQSFATFMLKTDGYLPVMFKFVPPLKSDCVIKPMMGIMRFTKILVAKLITGPIREIYKEQWKVEINGEAQRNFTVILQGMSEIPSIVIGNHNTVTFDATVPGCQDIVTVPVINTCCYHLKITLIEKSEYFHSKPSKLELFPNEQKNVEWTFNGKLDVPNVNKVWCTMTVISNLNELVGLPFENIVTINAHCEYSQLCATPRYIDFGDVPWGSAREVKFEIFNFGKSAVCYSLKAIPVSLGVGYDDIEISNVTGKLRPNENNTVIASFVTKLSKEHVIQIVYFTRINEFSEAVTNHPPIDLFSMRYNCIHPALQIEECVEHDLGGIFSKLDMWTFFNADEINEQLMAVKEGEIRNVKINLPTFECRDRLHRIRFVLRNVSKFDLTVTFTRIRKCECRATEVSKSISFRTKVLNCPHKDMLTMKPSHDTIVGGSYQLLDIFMNFNSATDDLAAYDMKLCTNRHIHFCFRMNTLPLGTLKLSPYSPYKHKRFLNMFIGAKEPPYQAYWIYNNTSKAATYEVMEQGLQTLNEVEQFPVITCFKNKGVVPPFSSEAIFFKFQPIEAKKYQVTLPLHLGPEKTTITLSGRGTYKYNHNLLEKFTRNKPKMSINLGELPVLASNDFIVVEVFPVWSTTEKLIYIRNVTRDRVMEYHWQKCVIEGVIEITLDKPTGLLNAEETLGIIMKLTSFENPAITTINLSCKIVDVTQKERHGDSLRKFEERQAVVEQYFMIDEKGTHTMENDYVIEPRAETYYLTLSITFQTISTLEISHNLEVEQFFAQNPLDSFDIALENFIKALNTTKKEDEGNIPVEKDIMLIHEDKSLITQIMECFIMDTLKSPIFEEMVDCQQKSTPSYYLQFKQDEYKNKSQAREAKTAQIKTFLENPPLRELSNILKDMIKESVQEIFF